MGVDRQPAVSTAAGVSSVRLDSVGAGATVNQNVAPLPGLDRTPMRPPAASMCFLEIANPMPVPGYS